MSYDGAISASRRVDLYVRASPPPAARDRQSSIAERLEQLDAADRIAAVETHTWPDQVPREEAAMADRYEAFAAWADANGVDLEPFFETRERRYLTSDRCYTALVLPLACLAVYEDDDLRTVYPHATDDRVRTVDDGVAALIDRVDGEARVPTAAGD